MTRSTRHGTRPVVTVLGASGFLGSAVTALLNQRPIRLRTVARRPTPDPAPGTAEREVRTADLTDRAALADAVAGSDAVVHLLAHRTSTGDWRVADGDDGAGRVNVTVMHDLIDILRDVPNTGARAAVVFAGTVRTDDTTVPATAYERQKLTAERALHVASGQGALHGTTLQLPTVFGQGTVSRIPDRGVVTAMIRRALADEPLTLWHDGSVRRDLLHVEDAAHAFVVALDHVVALAGRPWALGSGRSVRVSDLFHMIAGLVSARTGRPRVPVLTTDPPGTATEADLRSVTVDPSAFRSVTRWRPLTELQAALEHTVAGLAAANSPIGSDKD